MDNKTPEEMRKELVSASKPLIDYIYKYGGLYAKIVVEKSGLAVNVYWK